MTAISDPETADLDGDGVTESGDDDIDGDGDYNEVDLFPRNAEEWYDSDGDGGNDNKGRVNDREEIHLFDVLNKSCECATPYSIFFKWMALNR